MVEEIVKVNGEEKIGLKREVGTTAAIMIIVGAIIGSGIYVSPKGFYATFL